MNRMVVFWLAVLLGIGGVLLIRTGRDVRNARQTPSNVTSAKLPEWLKEFELTDQDGRPFGTAELKGSVYVVNFFFATCPSVCRAENAKVQTLCHEFGPKGVKFVSITCDPEKDTPSSLKTYAQLFNADHEQWKFLTGDLLYIRRVGGEIFEVPVDRQTHTERLVVVDRWGKVRGRHRWDKPEEVEELRKLLDSLVEEKSEPAANTAAVASPPAAIDATGDSSDAGESAESASAEDSESGGNDAPEKSP